MNNRNTILFIVLSLGLLGLYTWVNTRYAPPPPPRPAVVQAEVQPATVQPAAPVAAVSAAAGQLPPSNPAARFHLETPTLKLTWRNEDGALVQARWASDGAPFFSEAETTDGKAISREFPGLGALVGSRFAGDPVVAPVEGGRTVTFADGLGNTLVYQVPDRGHVLEVRGTLAPASGLLLVPRPADLLQVHKMGRIFSVTDKGVDAVEWTKILDDPFVLFRAFGAKRKDLPPASDRLGLDAGLDLKTHYFAAIWHASRVPSRDANVGYVLGPDAAGHVSARLFLGPKQAQALMAFHPAGDMAAGKPFLKVVDYGFFGLVAQLFFLVLRTIHGVVANWGWSIVLFSILLRMALWPLNTKTSIQMLRMKELEPHQKALQAKYEKFGSDMTKKAEMQKELMAFYKKNGHNPMGGCLPMLLQMPVFLAMWSMLQSVFELRHAPFFGWIVDLSAKDPFYVLPVLMGASMIAQQAMSPAVGDPAQRKMMMVLMPVMMTVFFAQSAAGLCLYYLIFNLVGMAQTWWVMKNYKPQPIVV
jgi:YidC/Oxa1 family membrane protein insertase